jgi:hypothetical protein
MRYFYILIVLISFISISCDNGPVSPSDNPTPGPGIWCITTHSLLGIINLYNLNKYSFYGDLMYRGDDVPYISNLEIKNDTGELYYTIGKSIDTSNSIIKRDNAGNYLAGSFITEGYGLRDISVNQSDGSVWVSIGSYPNQIVHLDKDFNTLLDGINIVEANEVSCDSMTNQCWTHGEYPSYGPSYILKIDPEGNMFIGDEGAGVYYGGFEASYPNHRLWASNILYDQYGHKHAEIDIYNSLILDMAVDQNDGSAYYCVEPGSFFVGKKTNQLEKFSPEGQLVWARSFDCTSISITDNSIWVVISPNRIMQLTKDGDILSQFQTTELITDLAVWNG